MEEKENQNVVVSEIEEGKGGNPNHVPAGDPEGKGGQFTTKQGTEGTPASEENLHEDDVGVYDLQEDKPKTALGSALADFIGKKKESLKREAIDFSNSVKDSIPEESKKFYENLSREEKQNLLYKSPNGYDKNKIKFATDEELNALLYAEAVENAKVQWEQQLALLEKSKKDIHDSIEEKLSQNNIDGISGVWKNENGIWVTKYPSDYILLKSSGSIDRKKEYYQGVLANKESPFGELAKATQKLGQLEEFIKNGEAYEALKMQLMKDNIDALEKNDDQIVELKNKQIDESLLESAKQYREKFVDVNSAYSQARKDKALWFKSTYDAIEVLGEKAKQDWKSMTSEERNVIHSYTGSGYSRFNKPLRGINHLAHGYSFGGEGMETFSEAVNNMTNAIEKCTWEQDIWVNRYIANNTKMFRIPGTKAARTLESMTDDELQTLVGTSFTDGGFVSAGAAKGTGYHTGHIVFNIYCPKGTKMAYVAQHSASGQGENEMILQRGYSYRITKVTKDNKYGYYFLDMEVVLGSDSTKPVGNALKELGNKHYYKPRGEQGEDYD